MEFELPSNINDDNENFDNSMKKRTSGKIKNRDNVKYVNVDLFDTPSILCIGTLCLKIF